MSRRITKVAVLGSGVMGTGIACHFANIGLEVLMLDIVPRDLKDEEKDNPAARNRMADMSLKAALKGRPAPLYNNDFAKRITTGNFEDDMSKIKDCDWVIEVVIERLDIKKLIFAQVDEHRKPGSLVTSNTSSIPIHLMEEGRSEDFKKHFCGTHFFNPVRYMKLLEIIPTPNTDQAVIDFLMHYGDVFLGKETVLCKDTPAFIANRIGVYSGMKLTELTDKYEFTIEQVDKLTGPAIARPKTGTFRLNDLVGLDTNAKVVEFVLANTPDDEYTKAIKDKPQPKYMTYLLENKFYGNKSKQGFYKKTKDENGKKQVLALDLNTLEYKPAIRPKFDSLNAVKSVETFSKSFPMILNHEDQGAAFLKEYFAGLFAYCSNRIPEISDDIYSMDDAMRAGYAWEYGPFEYWDTYGIQNGIDIAKAHGETVADWVTDMLAAGHTTFYKREDGVRKYYDIASKSYKVIPGSETTIVLDNFRSKEPVNKTAESILHDIGDGVLCLEFTSKSNSIGEGVLRGIQEAIDIAEAGDWKGLVIGNNGKNFSVGANIMMIGMFAFQQEWEELNSAVNVFQQTMMRCRYSAIPVVTATQGFAFGGGCELAMHSDAVVASAETYMGLVEAGIGLLPGGGGTKEFALRASDSFFEGDVQIPTIISKFRTVATAQVATSAHQAFDYGYLLPERDVVEVNTSRAIATAKTKVLELADKYVQPASRNNITVLGRTGLGTLYTAANELMRGNYASEHDIKIAKKIAFVLCGGDLTGTQQVSEQYLLDVEREMFLSLAGEKKTLERIQHMLQTNKPLRN